LINQSDGNLVIHDEKGRVRWASKTSGKGAGNLYMQKDGNLVLYSDDGNAINPGKATWASGTFGKGTGPYRVMMQDEGDLVIYDAFNEPIWGTHK
jgi:hypothetical protein